MSSNTKPSAARSSRGEASSSHRGSGGTRRGKHSRANTRNRSVSRQKIPNLSTNSEVSDSVQDWNSMSQDVSPTNFCRHFDRTGTCRYGDACKFIHRTRNNSIRGNVGNSIASSSAQANAGPESSPAVFAFLGRVGRMVKSRRVIRLDNPIDIDLWHQAWSALAMGVDINHGTNMLIMLLRLPAISSVVPPVSTTWRMIHKLCNYVSTQHASESLVSIELVSDTIEKRLIRRNASDRLPPQVAAEALVQVPQARDSAQEVLINVIKQSPSSIRAATLLSRVAALCKRAIAELEFNSAQDPSPIIIEERYDPEAETPWTGWHKPTIGWLQNGGWLSAPNLCQQYDDLQSYTETVSKLIATLTFYWGAGALFPKCRTEQKGREQICGTPLCVRTTSSGICSFRRSDNEKCTRPARWRCHWRGHSAICDTCLRILQVHLIGEPSRRASTDIYDGTVDREVHRHDGVAYVVRNLKSRRLPTTEPNWATTYRVSNSALIGVVRLGASCEPLTSDKPIEWAEIVPVVRTTQRCNEAIERANGRLAFRFLSRADLPSLKGDAEALSLGSKLAIIDLQVFVPEVIPVLSALTNENLIHNLRDIPFHDQLIGLPNSRSIIDNYESLDATVSVALENSEISIIRRLSEQGRHALSAKIRDLIEGLTLEGTQRNAFLSALSSGIHCTQGPPGTGKSYLGVALIIAFDLIRAAAQGEYINVGPVVVLSYKNHALDELLADLVKVRRVQGKIIRCGKTDHPLLKGLEEQTSWNEREAKKVLSERVDTLRDVRRATRDLRGLSSAFRDPSGETVRDWSPSRSHDRRGIEIASRFVFLALRFHVAVSNIVGDPPFDLAYSILKKFACDDVSVKSDEDSMILKGIIQLADGMEHWSNEGWVSRALFLITQWITGNLPPPRCAASKEDGCILSSEVTGGYCLEIHACRFPNGCSQRRLENALLCGEHCCKHVGSFCGSARLLNSEFCGNHSCRICLKVGNIPVGMRLQDACAVHSCKLSECGQQAMGPSIPFCMDHVCRICATDCSRIHTSTARHRLEGAAFCVVHKCVRKDCSRARINCSQEQDYCEIHGCLVCKGRKKAVDSALPGSGLCQEHRCSFVYELTNEPCGSQRVDQSLFCSDHTCFICKQKDLPLTQPVVEQAPRNVCHAHPLCLFMSDTGIQCNEVLIRANKSYCDRHSEEIFDKSFRRVSKEIQMQCEGITKRKKRCKTKGFSQEPPFYCDSHFDQKPESGSPVFGDEQVRESESDGEGDDPLPNNDTKESDMPENDTLVSCERDILKGNLPDKITPTWPEKSGDEFESAPSTSSNSDNPECECLPNETASSEQNNPENRSGFLGEQSLLVAAQNVTGASSDTNVLILSASNPGSPVNLKKESHSRCAEEDTPRLNSDDVMDGEYEEVERVAYNACGDELDLPPPDQVAQSSTEESDEDVMGDRMRHLLDIDGGDATIPSEDVDDLDDVVDTQDPSNLTQDFSASDPSQWGWNEAREVRFRLVADFLHFLVGQVSKLALLADGHIQEARNNLAEQSALALSESRIVGATVVGATRRLHALRSSEPFAMLVEEAGEVFEPTLLSVLSVRSLQKLELIGDHRQLPAFIPQCWFAFEMTLPSIKVSLFERLVENEVAPCSVLDVQRRMRSEICDLTRCEYTDVVVIQDHSSTVSQRVADRVIASTTPLPKLVAERSLWAERGNLVPGMKHQVFFWNLESNEGRGATGVSRCNIGEANSVAALVRWLTFCGIPSKSITVITPYKGQQRVIFRKLRQERIGAAAHVSVSTVDRFQGDENDIIILSLVSSKPGNRFVALRNRFIVAASRARIGFYIIGSQEALSKSSSGSAHWQRMIQDLKAFPQESPRIGSALAIRCPRHSQISKEVKNICDFPSGIDAFQKFCTISCCHELPWCGHQCKLQCHGLLSESHTVKCLELVDRPCEDHRDVILICNELQEKSSEASLSAALLNFKCEVTMFYRRDDCPHSVEVSCDKYRSLVNNTVALDECSEIVEDFIHPSCGHVFSKPSCIKRRQWESNPPSCVKRVTHHRSCGCKVKMMCHERVEELALDSPPACMQAVQKPLPRCSHARSSRCFDATLLSKHWIEQGGEGVDSASPVVVYGVHYGPSESELYQSVVPHSQQEIPQCLQIIDYKASCGHVKQLRCADAFSLASGCRSEDPCEVEIGSESPLCGHIVPMACHLKSLYGSMLKQICGERVLDGEDEKEVVVEETMILASPLPHPKVRLIRTKCTKSFLLVRTCGHKQVLKCARLFSLIMTKNIPHCSEKITLDRTCGHQYITECHKREEVFPPCKVATADFYVYPLCRYSHKVRPGTCGELTDMQATLDLPCPILVNTKRPRCGHNVSVPCHSETQLDKSYTGNCASIQKIDGCEQVVVTVDVKYGCSEANIDLCKEPATLLRSCGHMVSGKPCHTVFDWAEGSKQISPCSELSSIVSPICGHNVSVPCYNAENIANASVWGPSDPRVYVFEENISDGEGDRLTLHVIQGVHNLTMSPLVQGLDCGLSSKLLRPCGHEVEIDCCKLQEALGAVCDVEETVMCADCGGQQSISCAEVQNTVPTLCKLTAKRLCSVCNINMTDAECHQKVVECNREVYAHAPCGHKIVWTCGEEDLRGKGCLQCIRQKWLDQLTLVKKPHQLNFDGASLLTGLKMQAMYKISGLDIEVEEVVEVDDDLQENIFSAFQEIALRNVDVLGKAVENEEWSSELAMIPVTPMDIEHAYDIVYTIMRNNNSTGDMFTSRETLFGIGVKANLLSVERLYSDCGSSNSDGMLQICIAGAYRVRGLTGKDPFRPSISALPKMRSSKPGKKKMSQREILKELSSKANDLAEKNKRAGYDFVVSPSGKSTGCDRVYWIKNSVIPVMRVTIRLLRTCSVCLENIVPMRGWVCEENHYICRRCFDKHIKIAGEADATTRVIDSDGALLCPTAECEKKFDPLLLLQQKHDATDEELSEMFAGLSTLRMKRFAEREVTEALQAQKQALESEFARIRLIDDRDERQAELLRLQIIDEILTLKCPNPDCRKAFMDFEGCFALSCFVCGTTFCAWCFYWDTDVHSHVASCREASRSGLFHEPEVFNQHHKERKSRLIAEKLALERPEVRSRAFILLEEQLLDIGFDSSRVADW